MPDVRGILLVCVVALALRIAHVLCVAQHELTHTIPGMDRWLQMEVATAVADGDLLGGPLSGYESGPAYAIVLGLVYGAVGRSWLAVLLLQAIVGALVPLLLYYAGTRLASRRVGVAAALLAAAYGPAMFHEAILTKFALVPFVVSALLAALAGATTPLSFAAGLALAAFVALRANAVLLVPVVVGWLVLRGDPASRGMRVVALGLGMLVVAAPLAWRRQQAAEVTEQGSLWGIHFYVGSQLEGNGGYRRIPDVADDVFGHVDDARAVAEEAVGRTLTPGEVSRYWFRRGVDEIRRDPAGYLRLTGRKIVRLLAPREEDVFGDDHAAHAAWSPVLGWLTLGFGTIAPLALVGLARAVRRPSGLSWCAAVVAIYAGSLLVFFVTGRYRLPLVPAMLLLAGHALVQLGETWRSGHTTRVASEVALLLAIAGALGTPIDMLVRLGLVTTAAIAIAAGTPAPSPAALRDIRARAAARSAPR